MRTSATGTSGFTLVEILVVVAIAGIILALAAVNLFPTDEEVARRETGMLALALEGARDDAWFGGRPTAVTFEDSRVRQWRLNNDRRWEADPTREKGLGDNLRVTGLFVEGQALGPEQRLVFLPDGFGVPFRVAVEVRGLARAIEGDAAGAVTAVVP
jgi:general secretion pathway protein H